MSPVHVASRPRKVKAVNSNMMVKSIIPLVGHPKTDLFGSFCAAKKSKLPLVRELFHCFAGFCGFVLLATIEPSFVLCHFGLSACLFVLFPSFTRAHLTMSKFHSCI